MAYRTQVINLFKTLYFSYVSYIYVDITVITKRTGGLGVLELTTTAATGLLRNPRKH